MLIDLGADYEITEFYYTANDNYSPPWEGRIKDYELYFSLDAINWGTPVVAEQFFQSPYRQYELLTSEVVRYVKFHALNSYYEDERTSVAEIDFRGRVPLPSNTLETNVSTMNQIKFSPNPVSNFLKIEGLEGNGSIRVFSPIGLLIGEVKYTDSFVLMDMTSYPSGVLMISIFDVSNVQISSKKILKVK